MESYILEQIIVYLMVIFGLFSIFLYWQSLRTDANFSNVAIFEILFIVILAILAQTIIMIRIWRQH